MVLSKPLKDWAYLFLANQKIRTFMGPPLEVTFKEEISEEGAAQAVKIYRDYYETKGQFEAHLYDGIKRGSRKAESRSK